MLILSPKGRGVPGATLGLGPFAEEGPEPTANCPACHVPACRVPPLRAGATNANAALSPLPAQVPPDTAAPS